MEVIQLDGGWPQETPRDIKRLSRNMQRRQLDFALASQELVEAKEQYLKKQVEQLTKFEADFLALEAKRKEQVAQHQLLLTTHSSVFGIVLHPIDSSSSVLSPSFPAPLSSSFSSSTGTLDSSTFSSSSSSVSLSTPKGKKRKKTQTKEEYERLLSKRQADQEHRKSLYFSEDNLPSLKVRRSVSASSSANKSAELIVFDFDDNQDKKDTKEEEEEEEDDDVVIISSPSITPKPKQQRQKKQQYVPEPWLIQNNLSWYVAAGGKLCKLCRIHQDKSNMIWVELHGIPSGTQWWWDQRESLPAPFTVPGVYVMTTIDSNWRWLSRTDNLVVTAFIQPSSGGLIKSKLTPQLDHFQKTLINRRPRWTYKYESVFSIFCHRSILFIMGCTGFWAINLRMPLVVWSLVVPWYQWIRKPTLYCHVNPSFTN